MDDCQIPISITDAIESQTVAGGGVFVHFDQISEKSAQVCVNTEVQNENTRSESVIVETTLTDADGKIIRRISGKLSLQSGEEENNPSANGSEESEAMVAGYTLFIECSLALKR